MAEISDYISGKVLDQVKMAFTVLDSSPGSLADTDIGKMMVKSVKKFEALILTTDKAKNFITEAASCASGQRVCIKLFPESPYTESIFLDELANAMVEAGQAKYVTKEEAFAVMDKYESHPIIISKVSGKYAEICRTWPDKCLYWNMEKKGLHCLEKSL